jgi:cytochrome c oxidase subunit II
VNRKTTVWVVVIAAIILGCIVLACAGVLLWSWVGPRLNGVSRTQFSSNGEQIYFTATSQRGAPITPTIGGGGMMGRGMMGGGMLTCAGCHGANGRGGRKWMMMGTFVAADIRYTTLTSASAQQGAPFSDEDIRRAITQGVDQNGQPLKWPMPRWNMSADDLNDLLAFLKTLK